MVFCPKCGKEIKEGELFCSDCGHRLNVELDNETPALPKDESMSKKIDSASSQSKSASTTPTMVDFVFYFLGGIIAFVGLFGALSFANNRTIITLLIGILIGISTSLIKNIKKAKIKDKTIATDSEHEKNKAKPTTIIFLAVITLVFFLIGLLKDSLLAIIIAVMITIVSVVLYQIVFDIKPKWLKIAAATTAFICIGSFSVKNISANIKEKIQIKQAEEKEKAEYDEIEAKSTQEHTTEASPITSVTENTTPPKTNTIDMWNEIHLGMTPDDIYALLGECSDESNSDLDVVNIHLKHLHYDYDDINLWGINEPGILTLNFQMKEGIYKLEQCIYQIGMLENEVTVLNEEKMNTYYNTIFDKLNTLYGKPELQEKGYWSSPGKCVKWYVNGVSEIMLEGGLDFLSDNIGPYVVLQVDIPSDNNGSSNNTTKLTDDDLDRIDKALKATSFPLDNSVSLKKMITDTFKDYTIDGVLTASDSSIGYYEYTATVTGNYYANTAAKASNTTSKGTIHYTIMYMQNSVSVCTVAVDDVNGDVYKAMSNILFNM